MKVQVGWKYQRKVGGSEVVTVRDIATFHTDKDLKYVTYRKERSHTDKSVLMALSEFSRYFILIRSVPPRRHKTSSFMRSRTRRQANPLRVDKLSFAA